MQMNQFNAKRNNTIRIEKSNLNMIHYHNS